MSQENTVLAEKIANNCKKNLDRGRASAVGIGLFAAIVKNGGILLRNRTEKNSLIYDQDLSEKWEFVGGGVDLKDFATKGDYTGTIFNTLKNEISEETGLSLQGLKDNFSLLPAWLTDEESGQVDLAFVTTIDFDQLIETEEFRIKLAEEKIKFFSIETLLGEDSPNVISPRMRFLIASAIKSIQAE